MFARSTFSFSSSTSTEIACGTSSRVSHERLLAHELGDLRLDRQVGALLRREVERPLGQQRRRARRAARRCRRRSSRSRDGARGSRRGSRPPASAARCGRPSAGRPCSARSRPARRARRRAAAMKRSPAPIRSRAESTKSTPSTSSKARVDRVLHPLGERVERPLEARQVGEDELVVVAVRDPEDAAARRLRLVGDDRDLAAAERVHERRLADVRPARDGDEARLHGRFQVSGSSFDAGAYVGDRAVLAPEVDALDLPLVQPLAAAAARRRRDADRVDVAGAHALARRLRDRGALRADAERIGRVLDVDAVDERARPSAAASRRRDSSSTARTRAPPPPPPARRAPRRVTRAPGRRRA